MLLLSLITLFAGPLLFQWLSRTGRVARTLDHIIVVALIVLVVVLLVPDIIEPCRASVTRRRPPSMRH